MKGPSRSLATRMVVVFSGLLAGIGAFMVAFFPRGMAHQAERSTEKRAVSVAQVMAAAVAPAIEFEDEDHAAEMLTWLETAPDARFATLLRADGGQLAAWHPERIPASVRWPSGGHIAFSPGLLTVSVPVAGVGGGAGLLHVAFSLDELQRERGRLTRTVAVAAGIVVLVGVFATLLATTLMLRPIRRITDTAQKIARGDLPPVLPELPGQDEIADMASSLRAMLERVHERGQQDLLRASRHAGMAEVATGVLHNVGNVLTSVNVTVELLRERLRAMPAERLRQLRDLLRGVDPATLDAEKVAAIATFIDTIATANDAELARWATELDALRGHVDHIKRVVAMQNAYARQGGVAETRNLTRLVTEAIDLACPASRRGGIEIDTSVPDGDVTFDHHRVLHVLVNLIANARDAVLAGGAEKRISIRARMEHDALTLAVTDTGQGFSPETSTKLFAAGFTTKQHGHGYGLHSSALSMRQIGGDLTASSVGVGHGATFTLLVPLGKETPS